MIDRRRHGQSQLDGGLSSLHGHDPSRRAVSNSEVGDDPVVRATVGRVIGEGAPQRHGQPLEGISRNSLQPEHLLAEPPVRSIQQANGPTDWTAASNFVKTCASVSAGSTKVCRDVGTVSVGASQASTQNLLDVLAFGWHRQGHATGGNLGRPCRTAV